MSGGLFSIKMSLEGAQWRDHSAQSRLAFSSVCSGADSFMNDKGLHPKLKPPSFEASRYTSCRC